MIQWVGARVSLTRSGDLGWRVGKEVLKAERSCRYRFYFDFADEVSSLCVARWMMRYHVKFHSIYMVD